METNKLEQAQDKVKETLDRIHKNIEKSKQLREEVKRIVKINKEQDTGEDR